MCVAISHKTKFELHSFGQLCVPALCLQLVFRIVMYFQEVSVPMLFVSDCLMVSVAMGVFGGRWSIVIWCYSSDQKHVNFAMGQMTTCYSCFVISNQTTFELHSF